MTPTLADDREPSPWYDKLPTPPQSYSNQGGIQDHIFLKKLLELEANCCIVIDLKQSRHVIRDKEHLENAAHNLISTISRSIFAEGGSNTLSLNNYGYGVVGWETSNHQILHIFAQFPESRNWNDKVIKWVNTFDTPENLKIHAYKVSNAKNEECHRWKIGVAWGKPDGICRISPIGDYKPSNILPALDLFPHEKKEKPRQLTTPADMSNLAGMTEVFPDKPRTCFRANSTERERLRDVRDAYRYMISTTPLNTMITFSFGSNVRQKKIDVKAVLRKLGRWNLYVSKKIFPRNAKSRGENDVIKMFGFFENINSNIHVHILADIPQHVDKAHFINVAIYAWSRDYDPKEIDIRDIYFAPTLGVYVTKQAHAPDNADAIFTHLELRDGN